MPWIMWLSSRFILLLVERKWDSKSLSGNLWSQELRVSFPCNFMIIYLIKPHPRRPRGSQSGEEKRRDKSFQARAEEPLGTYSHRTISIRSSEYWLLIGHKKCFVLLCPIGEQFLLSSFREFVHDGYCLDHGLSGSCTKEMHAVRKLSVWYKLSISKYCLPEN